MPDCLLNCQSLHVFKLGYFGLNLHRALSVSLRLLKELELTVVWLSEYLDISGCPLLDSLILFACNQEAPVNIFAPNLKLKYLKITEGWRDARSPHPYMPRFHARLPFLHGALHLLPGDFQAEDSHHIAAFDVEKEEYRVIALPDVYFCMARPLTHASRLEELRGSLCLVLGFGDPYKMMQLWLLTDYHGGKWEKQYTVDLSSTISCIRASPLAIADDGLILLYLKCLTKEDELCWFTTKENQFAGVMGVNSVPAYYVESFLSLGSR